MSIQDDLVEFLRNGREVRYLNFEAFGYRFSPGQYAIVANDIEKGRIPVRDSSLLPMSKGAGASWKYGLNEFWFLPDADIANNDAWRALSAHEATHAVHDMLKPGIIERPVAEAIGYLAEAIVRKVQGKGPLTDKTGAVDPIRAEAMRVAVAIWDNTGLLSMKVSDADADAFRSVVARHPHYVAQGPSVEYHGLDD
ncbi:hypothetical protein [Roseomonas rosulenta]|uniref:hypothetical protein n=1 Tax=Roseomonas rosulenta TaxID=2748667 RepID=UPI0018DF7562|nr:hypothetical protein [Roseomonas rosulenta]